MTRDLQLPCWGLYVLSRTPFGECWIIIPQEDHPYEVDAPAPHFSATITNMKSWREQIAKAARCQPRNVTIQSWHTILVDVDPKELVG